MIGSLLAFPILMAPEIAEAVADGAATLAVAAGTHLGKGIVQGAAAELGEPGTQAAFGAAASGAMDALAARLRGCPAPAEE